MKRRSRLAEERLGDAAPRPLLQGLAPIAQAALRLGLAAFARLVPAGGRGVPADLPTGLCSGSFFMLAGRLMAAAAGHALDNLRVAGACASWPAAPERAGARP